MDKSKEFIAERIQCQFCNNIFMFRQLYQQQKDKPFPTIMRIPKCPHCSHLLGKNYKKVD